MIKRTVKETVTEYDKDGNIVKQTVTETVEDDDTQYLPYNAAPLTTVPCAPSPWWGDDHLTVNYATNSGKGE